MATKNSKDYSNSAGALFIPAGILAGLGVGFYLSNIPAWMFIGLGTGFFLFAITAVFKK